MYVCKYVKVLVLAEELPPVDQRRRRQRVETGRDDAAGSIGEPAEAPARPSTGPTDRSTAAGSNTQMYDE